MSISNDDQDKLLELIRALENHIEPPVPNPAPLGLFAFGLTTALLQMKHTRLTGYGEGSMGNVENVVWGFALFYGGLLQLIAGLGEIRRNNIFGYTAFLSYGGFWMSLGTSNILLNFHDEGLNPKAVQAMLVLMGIFTFILWICTFKQNKTLCLLIFSLMMTFFLLAGGIDNDVVDYVAGYFGLFTSLVAFWLGAAELMNDILGGGTEIIPLGKFQANIYRKAGNFHVPGRIYASPSNVLQKAHQNEDSDQEEEECHTISDRFKMMYSEKSVERGVEGFNHEPSTRRIEEKPHTTNNDNRDEGFNYYGEKRVIIEEDF